MKAEVFCREGDRWIAKIEGDLYTFQNRDGQYFRTCESEFDIVSIWKEDDVSRQRDELLKVLEDLTSYCEVNTCLHESTYRGGAIWEICNDCGAKWADDEGGKPKSNYPLPIQKARKFLDKIKNSN